LGGVYESLEGFCRYGCAFRIFGHPAARAKFGPRAATAGCAAQYRCTRNALLIALQTPVSTKEDKAGKQVLARTLEPIPTADGSVVASGALVRGHIDKVQAAGKVGRARLWLTFDDIRTSSGWTPLVADLIDAPGVHSIRVLYDHEGVIEAPTSKRDDEMLAMAEAAFVAAEPGLSKKDKKDAAMGAAMGAATAFMATSGLGQELKLEPNMKLELALERPLYFGKI
jgi:hypothetical protein